MSEQEERDWYNQAYVDDLQRQLREARALLRAFVDDGAESDLFGACCYCFKSIPEHKPDCHWLLAKQYLEPTP